MHSYFKFSCHLSEFLQCPSQTHPISNQRIYQWKKSPKQGEYCIENCHQPNTQTCRRYDILTQIHEVTSSPTPLTEFLQDPFVISKLTQHRSRSRSKHGRGREQNTSPTRLEARLGSSSLHGRHQGGRSSPTLMGLILAEEDRQAQDLKAMLRTAGDCLEYETRRANNADSRAEYAEMRTKDAVARLMATEFALSQEEIESKRWKEEAKRFEDKAQEVERELGNLREDMRRVERDRDEVKGRTSMMRDEARKLQLKLNDYQARERGKEEGRRLARERLFEEGWEAGHEEGFEAGRQDGYEEGLRDGGSEGFKRGRRQGKDGQALKAFDKFLDSNATDDGDTINVSVYVRLIRSMLIVICCQREERTRGWAYSYQ
jgi:flagellar biosynthesis/type III secretory pathway protein FliH